MRSTELRSARSIRFTGAILILTTCGSLGTVYHNNKSWRRGRIICNVSIKNSRNVITIIVDPLSWRLFRTFEVAYLLIIPHLGKHY